MHRVRYGRHRRRPEEGLRDAQLTPDGGEEANRNCGTAGLAGDSTDVGECGAVAALVSPGSVTRHYTALNLKCMRRVVWVN